MGRGRPRKTSVSSVETINEDELLYAPEKTVLEPLTVQELALPDDWPLFELKDAVVYYRDAEGEPETHWMGNLLHANYDGPFVVRGKLDAHVHGNDGRLQPRAQKDAYITIPKVSLFSLEGEEGSAGLVKIWAGGECGWYELTPSQAYLPIYRQMHEAAIMFFSLEDIIMEKTESINLNKLLFEYAYDVGEGITLEAAKARCIAHAPFFLSHCHKEENSPNSKVAWSKTRFWRFLRHECANVLETLRNRDKLVLGPTIPPPTTRRPTPPPPAPPREKSPSFDPRPPRNRADRIVPHIVDHEMLDVDSEASSRPSVSRKRRTPHADSLPVRLQDEQKQPSSDFTQPQPEIDNEAMDLLLAVLEDLWVESEEKQRHKSKITQTTIKTGIFTRCSTTYADPLVILAYFSRRLVESLPSKWEGTPVMEFLHEAAAEPNPTLGHIPYNRLIAKLRRRTSKRPPGGPGQAAVSASTPSEKKEEPPRVVGLPLAGSSGPELEPEVEGRRAVRPTTPSLTQDQFSRRGRGRPKKTMQDMPKPAGKMPRLSLVARKRGQSDDESEPLDFSRISKVARISSQIEDDSSDEDGSSSGSEENSDVPQVPIVIRTEAAPSTEPKGPEGTWVCEEEDCGFVVRAADEPDGRGLVEEHIQQHGQSRENGKEKLIDFAVAEGNSRHLPVSHLLDKIRRLGGGGGTTVSGGGDAARETYPNPIKRHLGW